MNFTQEYSRFIGRMVFDVKNKRYKKDFLHSQINFYIFIVNFCYLKAFGTDLGVTELTFPNKTAILCLQRPLFKEATLIQMLSWELYIQTSLLLILPPEIATQAIFYVLL